MTNLKIKDVEKKANGTKSTVCENEAYFVTFNLTDFKEEVTCFKNFAAQNGRWVSLHFG